MRLTHYRIDGLRRLSTLAVDGLPVSLRSSTGRDVDINLADARAAGLVITHVIETQVHTNHAVGRRELFSALTGASHPIDAGRSCVTCTCFGLTKGMFFAAGSNPLLGRPVIGRTDLVMRMAPISNRSAWSLTTHIAARPA